MEKFGRYELLQRVGQDEVAEAWIAAGSDRKAVALKKIHPPNRAFVETFLAEARALQALSHPNLVPIVDVGTEKDECFLAIRYAPGKTLEALIPAIKEDGGPIALWIAAMCARGLGYAHAKGIVHRAVSPQKIHISFSGEVRVADFGLAKIAHFLPREHGLVRGNVQYMSPEQVDANPLDLDARTDVFSLALVLWEMLTGAPLFRGTPSEVLHLIATIRLPDDALRDQPEDVRTLLQNALARERETRIQSAVGFEEALLAILGKGGADAARAGLEQMMAKLKPESTTPAAPQPAAPPPAPATVVVPMSAPLTVAEKRAPMLVTGIAIAGGFCILAAVAAFVIWLVVSR